jgi:hypothetical protein
MNKKPLISIEDQLAPLGGLWEKKPFPWPNMSHVPMVIVSIPNQAKKKSPPRMANCDKCKWQIFDGINRIWICKAVGGDDCLYINNSPRCKRLYRAR